MSINVLVVDDSKITRSVIKKTIKIAGIDFNKIFEAENGKEALEVLGNEWIDLIFTDINMPIMGGAEMIEKLGDDGLLKTIPVIVVSTERSQTRIEQLQKCGVKAYVKKPFHPEEIKKIVDDIIGRD